MTRASKLQLLTEVQKILNLSDENLEKLPLVIQALTQPPVVVTFAFDATTGQLRQVATSNLPMVPEAYQLVAQVATNVSQQFQNIALEVAKHVANKGNVGEDSSPHRSNER